DAAVGSLSIEHKKRSTIGVELAAKVRCVLFLLTISGLKLQSPWTIISFLRQLACLTCAAAHVAHFLQNTSSILLTFCL
ncbi:hypothetical protein B0H34DRAFT_664409, partial [Crassisporium funariophilum]